MAIPTWTWSGRTGRPDPSPAADSASVPSSRPTADDADEAAAAESTGERESGNPKTEASAPRLSRLSSEFDLLSSPVRLEILLSLADRDRPLRYTDLRDGTSIEDNGKLNYHLRRLEGLVASREDGDERGYVLTARGRRLLERVPHPGSSDSHRRRRR